MRGALQLLLFVGTVTLVASKLHESPYVTECFDGHYNFRGVCFQCTPCGDFMYELAKCTDTSNTVCGWCGNKPNLDKISDEVLVSYQTKCLMSSLDFIGMTKLKDELVNVFDDEKDSEEMIDSNEINYDMARNSLEDVYDSQEHQLPDPTYEEGDDSSSSEEIGEEEKTDENEIGSEIVSEKVKAYMIEKSEKVPSSVKIAKGKTTIVSHEEAEATFREIEALPNPVRKINQDDYDSSEESNEREIKWDNWVDDQVKPIRTNVEVVEAEEIEEFDQLIAKSLKNRRKILNDETESSPLFIKNLGSVFVICMGMIIVVTILSITYALMRAERKEFLGVPTDSQDYHMIIDSSNYIEKLESKEKQASRHVHVNPVFDV
ncbi:TNFR-Cys domain-containing protein [Caenorhabditis elegans]|uniref:TNFR-Cys domain-containing protein n=1 Tax=Caenorhabditis elegans TaxID=6239 RepID=Q22095_CAEEL|nr:TNFR-Cys domain-containing protein [Caenorhabditis elegans]CCD74381.1 TNFR-Cys domain-containing protein [Caenorhabditis elegans]|eukprot:NP_001024869.1 Uncharacterized protein CELE_T02C5.1 [Caenorhabditis elegans]